MTLAKSSEPLAAGDEFLAMAWAKSPPNKKARNAGCASLCICIPTATATATADSQIAQDLTLTCTSAVGPHPLEYKALPAALPELGTRNSELGSLPPAPCPLPPAPCPLTPDP